MSGEERRTLRDLLKTHGCQETIKVWANHDNTILDGHNRYEICREEEIPYKVKAINLETRQDCIDWICNLQLGRRNSSAKHKSYLRGKRYNAEKGEQGGDRKSKCHDDTLIDTAEKIAEETGVSPATVKRDAKFADAVDDLAKPVKDAVLTGEVKATSAEVQSLSELPKAEQRAVIAQVKSGEADSIADAIKKPPGGINFNPSDWEGNGEKPAEVLDGEKKPVPAKLREIFSRAKELTDLERQLQAVVKKLEDSQNDPLFSYVHTQSTVADIDNAKRAIRFAKPFAVCPYCKGKACKACKGQGWVNKPLLKQAPAEMRP